MTTFSYLLNLWVLGYYLPIGSTYYRYLPTYHLPRYQLLDILKGLLSETNFQNNTNIPRTMKKVELCR